MGSGRVTSGYTTEGNDPLPVANSSGVRGRGPETLLHPLLANDRPILVHTQSRHSLLLCVHDCKGCIPISHPAVAFFLRHLPLLSWSVMWMV